MMLDIFLVANDAPLSQLSGILSGFVPEALSFGAIFIFSKNVGLILAGITVPQNVYEGFKVYKIYKEIIETTNYSRLEIIFAFTLMVMLGPIASVTGYIVLSGHLQIISVIMLFAAGGILYIYIIFQDIALQSNLRNTGRLHWVLLEVFYLIYWAKYRFWGITMHCCRTNEY